MEVVKQQEMKPRKHHKRKHEIQHMYILYIVTRVMVARSGLLIVLKNPSHSVRSTVSPAGGAQSNSRTSAARKSLTCSIPRPIPRQNLRPAPNGIILISLGPGNGPTSSASPPGMNRSGRNSWGPFHVLPSLPMSPSMKWTRRPVGGTAATPATSAASSART
ncbi:hypothetical protein SEVIR_1G167901v4 [Setaria viridis]